MLDGLSTCPAACTADMWASIFERECLDGYGYVVRDRINERGHTAVTAPGILRLLAKAHREFGKLPWADLCGPAIAFATGWAQRFVIFVRARNSANQRRVYETFFSQNNFTGPTGGAASFRQVTLPAGAPTIFHPHPAFRPPSAGLHAGLN